jgi:hypothetical protein
METEPPQTSTQPSPQSTPDDDIKPEDWVDGGPLEGDEKQQAQQVLELAKKRFRDMLKQTFDDPHFKAASREKKKTSRKRAAATAVDAFADVAGLSLEELAMMQIACLTQGVVDCATRAALEPHPGDDDDEDMQSGHRRFTQRPPGDPRRTHRHAELFDSTHLAHASARLMDSVMRSRSEGARHTQHAFTYEHLHRHVMAAAAAEGAGAPEPVEKTTEERAASLTDIVFSGIRVRPESAGPTPSPSEDPVRIER